MNLWIYEKVTFTLSRHELFELANAIHDASLNEVDFMKIKDRRIRKMFKNSIIRRHKLWLKLTHTAQEGKKV